MKHWFAYTNDVRNVETTKARRHSAVNANDWIRRPYEWFVGGRLGAGRHLCLDVATCHRAGQLRQRCHGRSCERLRRKPRNTLWHSMIRQVAIFAGNLPATTYGMCRRSEASDDVEKVTVGDGKVEALSGLLLDWLTALRYSRL
jgi:hypothetical protein